MRFHSITLISLVFWNISSHPSFVQQIYVSSLLTPPISVFILPISLSSLSLKISLSLFLSLPSSLHPSSLSRPLSLSPSPLLSLSLSLSLYLLIFLSPPPLFSFSWLVVILGGTDHWMWEWQDEHGFGEEEDFHIDGWIMHHVIYFMTGGMFTLTRDGSEIYFWWFDIRLHYTMQFAGEKEMLWRFCCGMEPTSIKKM